MKPNKPIHATFLGEFLYKLVIPPHHLLKLLLETVDWTAIRKKLMRDKDEQPITYSHTGRAACDPVVIFKMLVLQRWHPASDAKVEERAQTDLAYRYFLQLPIPNPIPDATSLSRYRTTWGKERMEALFQEVFRQIQSFGYASVREGIVGDATHQHASIQKPTARVLIFTCFEKLMIELRTLGESFPQQYDCELIGQLYLTVEAWSVEYHELIKAGQLSRKDRFTLLVQKILDVQTEIRPLVMVSSDSPVLISPEWGAFSQRWSTLAQILEENVSITPDVPTQKKETPTQTQDNQSPKFPEDTTTSPRITQKKGQRKIISLTDPEARSGYKNKTKRFTGYKVVASMTKDRFHPGVDTVPGNVPDMTQGIPLVKHAIETSGESPKAVGLDLGFSSLKNRKALHELGIQPGIEFQEPRNSRNPQMFATNQFQFDLIQMTVTCPAAQTTSNYSCLKDTDSYLFRFPGALCQQCPSRSQCTTSKTGRTVRCSQQTPLLTNDQAFLATADYEELRKSRWGLEARFGFGKKAHHLTKTPYYGLNKTKLHNYLVFIVLNLKRLLKLLYFPKLVAPKPLESLRPNGHAV